MNLVYSRAFESRKISKETIALALVAIIAFAQCTSAQVLVGEAADDGWGPTSDGIRCRLIAVPTDADDDKPDATKSTNSFARGDDLTFAVELKNVGDKPATLLGVRYGDSYGTSSGRLATASFGPRIFEFEFTDSDGKPVPRPKRVYLESMLDLSDASAHELAPGKSLVVLLRPAKFNSPMNYPLPPGSYRATVRYRGPTEEVLASIKKHWPDTPQAKAWSGEVRSNQVALSIAKDPNASPPVQLQWGEAKNGLRAAVEFRARYGDGSVGDAGDAVPLNTKVDVVLHLHNEGEQPISFVSETWRQDDRATAKDEAGNNVELSGTWYSGLPTMIRWTLQPGEVAEIDSAGLAVAADKAAGSTLEDPVGKMLIAKPGIYLLRYTIPFGGIQVRDDKGKVVIPAPTDWQGELTTAETPLEVRARTPEDDARDRAAYFVGRVEFVGKDGKAIDKGTLTARTGNQQGKPEPIDLHAGPIEIADCSPKPLTIEVRAPGYEEARFDYVELKKNETKRFELTPAEPTRFRLVSAADGKPIGGALVRYFNRSSEGASSGPFPTDGIEGPVWAISSPDGTVVLDTLQKSNSNPKFGPKVYFFYIEDADFSGHFLGPIKAGSDLGDIKLHFPLEVRGEIHGTKKELNQFAAEWDQPFDMRASDSAPSSLYAVSKDLKTKRVGNKLTFHLKGLRPGKLRIVCNFSPHPHSVSHTYGRRDPKEGDVVAEFEVTESTSGLVITPKGKATNQEK